MNVGGETDDNRPSTARRRRNRSQRRRTLRFGAFLRLTFIGSLIPGVGLIAAGRRRAGVFVLSLLVLLGIGAALMVVTTPTGELASYSGDREALLYAALGLATLAVVWTLLALISHRSLEPRDLTSGKRFAGALTVIVAASLVVTPMAMGARNALTHRDLIASISGGTTEKGEPESQTVPVTEEGDDPWEDIPRVNVLVLGADVGKGRLEEDDGIRPDTQIVASIDTDTGDTNLISLPRNLAQMPFPETSPLAEKYPNGYIDYATGDPTDGNSMLNSVYKNIPNLYPELGVSGSDANKLAVSGALGIDVHYYVMVNLDGFESIIDALNGITIDVSEAVPVSYGQNPDSSYCVNLAKDWIEPGIRHMDGVRALKYARSRCNTDNYRRMERQQCVMRAVIDRADPMRLATRYQSLAAATEGMVRTDIPSDLFPAFIELAVDVKGAELNTMNLDHDLYAEIGGSSTHPNYEGIHQAVQDTLDPSGDSIREQLREKASSSDEPSSSSTEESPSTGSSATSDPEAEPESTC